MSHMPGELFNLYLHQNYVDFFTEVDDLVRASEFLSFADILSGDWNVRLSVWFMTISSELRKKVYFYSYLCDSILINFFITMTKLISCNQCSQ